MELIIGYFSLLKNQKDKNKMLRTNSRKVDAPQFIAWVVWLGLEILHVEGEEMRKRKLDNNKIERGVRE